jgi:hypothetical protein
MVAFWAEMGVTYLEINKLPCLHDIDIPKQGLTNPLARRPGLVIPTFGLAEIISCMPDGLVKIYIGYCQYSRIYLYSYMLYVV